MQKIFLILAGCIFIYSCEKTITPNLDAATSQIVIQGNVTDTEGPYTVTINKSVGFYADNTYPAVSGAVVTISDDMGTTDILTETSAGTYQTHTLQGQSGHTYTLSVTSNDITYTASSTMPVAVQLDSITLNHTSGSGDKRIEAIANFQDPAGIKNYYQFEEYINGQLFTKNFYIFDDRLSDGKYIANTLRTDSAWINKGDLLKVNMYCIDENVHTYFSQLIQSGGSGAFNTTASPANPTSNISNGAFGYFSAHTVRSQTITIN
jgi:hypothetical protein